MKEIKRVQFSEELRTKVNVTWEYLKSHNELYEKSKAKSTIKQKKNTIGKAVLIVCFCAYLKKI
ncbi:MAG: hypothetical protein ACI9DK_001700 [Vicingaceae bacterium]